MSRQQFIWEVILVFVFCIAVVPALASGKTKRQTGFLECLHDIQSCNKDYKKQLSAFSTEAERQEYCQNYEPFFSCVNDTLIRCDSPEMESTRNLVWQLNEGAASLCSDPITMKLILKPENIRCFAGLKDEQKIEPCTHEFTIDLLMKTVSHNICREHERFQSCIDSVLSDTCSKESKFDYIYMTSLVYSGVTKARNVSACGGRSLENHCSTVPVSWILVVLSLCFAIKTSQMIVGNLKVND